MHDEIIGFLAATTSPAAEELAAADREGLGYVMNLSRVWAYQPAGLQALGALLGQVADAGGLTFRERGILVTSAASAMGDAYCSLAWGGKLAGEAGAELAAGVLRGDDAALDPQERVLARWARQVSRDPNATTAADVESLRQAGYDDERIFAITAFVALRIALSTVNDALGVQPDAELAESGPPAVVQAVTFGRPVAPARRSDAL